MEAKLIRILVDIELSRTEFEMLADYADATQQAVNVAAGDLMLIGLTLGDMEKQACENPKNFSPTASSGIPPWACQTCGEDDCICPAPALTLEVGPPEPPRGGDATGLTASPP